MDHRAAFVLVFLFSSLDHDLAVGLTRSWSGLDVRPGTRSEDGKTAEEVGGVSHA